jgi:hypothetical protein
MKARKKATFKQLAQSFAAGFCLAYGFIYLLQQL